jgi:hypothetical protein
MAGESTITRGEKSVTILMALKDVLFLDVVMHTFVAIVRESIPDSSVRQKTQNRPTQLGQTVRTGNERYS